MNFAIFPSIIDSASKTSASVLNAEERLKKILSNRDGLIPQFFPYSIRAI